MRRAVSKVRSFPALALLVLFSLPATAQESNGHSLLNDDWILRLGVQRSNADAKVGLGNPQLGTIPLLDFDALGLDPKFDSAWAHFLWQAPERWSWGFNYFRSKAEGQHLTSQDLQFGDLVIPAGTGVAEEFTSNFYVFNAYYDLYQRPNRAAGVGFGIYALDLGAEVQGYIGGAPDGRRATSDILAPLPALSMYYKHAFNEKWALWADAGWFSLNIDKYDGTLLASRLSLEYWPKDNWGVGANYTHVDVDLTIDEAVFDQRWDVRFDSFSLFLTLSF